MIPISVSVKNLVEKLQILSYKRINSNNIKNEVKNENPFINQQNNKQITTQVNYNYYTSEKEKKEENPKDKDSITNGEAIFLDPLSFDSFGYELMNKDF